MQNVYAKNDTYTLEMQIINNKNEDVNLYILLPKQYILYAMEYDNYILVKNYNGPNILMEEDIPSIKINKNDRLIAKKGRIGKAIGFTPMVLLFVGYLIIPLVFIGLTSMTTSFSSMSAT